MRAAACRKAPIRVSIQLVVTRLVFGACFLLRLSVPGVWLNCICSTQQAAWSAYSRCVVYLPPFYTKSNVARHVLFAAAAADAGGLLWMGSQACALHTPAAASAAPHAVRPSVAAFEQRRPATNPYQSISQVAATQLCCWRLQLAMHAVGLVC